MFEDARAQLIIRKITLTFTPTATAMREGDEVRLLKWVDTLLVPLTESVHFMVGESAHINLTIESSSDITVEEPEDNGD